MPLVALLFMIVALACFVVDALAKITLPVRLVSWGLAFLTIGISLIFLVETKDPITF